MKHDFRTRMREIFAHFLSKLNEDTCHYINGPETLPPPLTKAEEQVVFQNIRDGKPNARDPLITHNLRLVVYIAKKFESPAVNVEDLISIGTIGLMKAVDTFDATRKARFSTYASRCIENAILSPAHFQMEKRTHSFFKAAQMRQNGFSGLRKAVTFFYFKRYHVRVVV